jgi:hypothetical protein
VTPGQAKKAQGCLVVTATGRPGYLVHQENGWCWVSHTDGGQPVQTKTRPAALERSTHNGKH